MTSIVNYLSTDHRRCDDLLAQLENAVSNTEWDAALCFFLGFNRAIEHHFAMEQDVLFPAFEQALGSSAGPTAVMRSEHEQLRGLIDLLRGALQRREQAAFFDHADTLRIMNHQHNLKEESMLYPMADRMLSGRLPAVLESMEAVSIQVLVESE